VEETALSLAPVGATLIGVAGLRLREARRRLNAASAIKRPSTSESRRSGR
jgi:hypothetical protein